MIFVFAPHEFAHAFVAYKCGDATAKMRGRMTLNPIKHLDPAGFILCALTGFGWARPVPIDPYNFRNYRKGMFLTAIAGVVTNYILAFIGFMLLLPVVLFWNDGLAYLHLFFYYFFNNLFVFNLGVFVFNLLPLYPLDGFRVVQSLTRPINPVHRFLKTYGQYILIILLVESFLIGVLDDYTNLPHWINYLDILGYVQWFALNIIGYPIRLIGYLIYGLGVPPFIVYHI